MSTVESHAAQPGPSSGKGSAVLLIVAFLVSVLSVGLMYLRAADKPAENDIQGPKPVLTVTRAAPQWRQWSSTIEAAGSIEPWQEAVIGAQLSGLRLVEVAVDVGDTVEKGQLLARFDADMLKAEMAQLRADLAQAEAAAKQAETNRQRVSKLNSIGSLSRQEILRYQTEAETSRSQVAAVEARIAAKRLQLAYTDVKAPDAGVISSRQATLGAVVTGGQELFRLIRQNRLEWRGELTAAQMALCRPGLYVDLSLSDGSRARAQVRQLAPTLNPQTRLGIVYADLLSGSEARAGMYADGKLALAQTPALTIPAAGVVIRDGRSYVLKLQSGADTVPVTLQPVVTGRQQGDRIEIVEGLSDADPIVVDGAGFLDDGDLVRVVEQDYGGA
ncbi:MAG: efflux RND transporter periplasmic adaptor subunit [Gammaproteobacteria bacterium]